jgi:hypothetical protein
MRSRIATIDDDPDLFEIINGKPVLRDGAKLTVPLQVRDAMRKRGHLHDGHGNPPGHRPGFVMTDNTEAKRRLDEAYRAYEDDLTSAYLTTGEGSKGPIGQRVGDPCTKDGWPGHLKMVNGKMQCVPDRQNFNGSNGDDEDDDDMERAQSDAASKKQAAYAAYDAALTQAWRSKG